MLSSTPLKQGHGLIIVYSYRNATQSFQLLVYLLPLKQGYTLVVSVRIQPCINYARCHYVRDRFKECRPL